MMRLIMYLFLLLFPVTAIAGEKVKGMNFMVEEARSWETGNGSGYWMLHAKGVSHSVIGPLGTSPVECHGAGFWDKEGSWGEGICIGGAGDDTHTIHWKNEKGQEVGHWKHLSGTGRFAGIVGQGTHRATELPEGRGMSEWQGEVTLAE